MLDTTAVSGYFSGREAARPFIRKANVLVPNPIVTVELIAGYSMGSGERKNRDILNEFISSLRVRVVDIDEETGERYSAIFSSLRKSGTPIPTNDMWIAASAMQHGLPLLTMNAHFLGVPQILVDFCET